MAGPNSTPPTPNHHLLPLPLREGVGGRGSPQECTKNSCRDNPALGPLRSPGPQSEQETPPTRPLPRAPPPSPPEWEIESHNQPPPAAPSSHPSPAGPPAGRSTPTPGQTVSPAHDHGTGSVRCA